MTCDRYWLWSVTNSNLASFRSAGSSGPTVTRTTSPEVAPGLLLSKSSFISSDSTNNQAGKVEFPSSVNFTDFSDLLVEQTNSASLTFSVASLALEKTSSLLTRPKPPSTWAVTVRTVLAPCSVSTMIDLLNLFSETFGVTVTVTGRKRKIYCNFI